MENRNRQCKYGQPVSQWIKQEACFHVRLWCCSLSITTLVSLLANKFVQRVLHRQVSLAAVNQIFLIPEAMNEQLQNSKH